LISAANDQNCVSLKRINIS